MKNKVFLLALLLLIIAAAGTWAQNLPANLWSSPQSTTTEGRYRSNADDFIRPDSYLGVKFDKWFGLVSFLSDENNNGIATVGFAAKVSKVYVSAFYSGNLWANAPVNNYTEQEFITAPNGGVEGKTYNVYNNISVGGAGNPVNNIALLIGAADMGFRITYRTNHQSFKESGIVVPVSIPGPPQTSQFYLYKNYQTESGYMAPQIAWAMAKDLKKNGIRPYLTVDLVFSYDYQKAETVGEDSAGISGVKIGRSLNRFDPSIAAGLGGFTFYNKDGFKGSFDLDYVFTLNTYDNEYSYVEDGLYKIGKIKGTYSPGSNPYIEQSFMSNQFTPSVSGSWSEDRLALKFKLNLPLTFSGREQNSMTQDSSGKLIYSGQNKSTSTFVFRPDIRLALQYKLVPGKLTLNTGARIQATALTRETIDQKTYDADGIEVAGSKQKQHNNSFINIGSGTQFVSRFSIGPVFNFTDNVWVEASTGVSNVFGDGAIDVFAPGGLFSFGSILVALKF
jgi:hypothetical protein